MILEPDRVTAASFGICSVGNPDAPHLDVDYQSHVPGGSAFREVVRLNDDLALIFGSMAPFHDSLQQQAVSGRDWIHIHFQVKGGREERLGDVPIIATASHSCIIARHHCGSPIRRKFPKSEELRAVNLYLRPALVEKLMGQSGAHFSRNWAWLLTDSECSQNSAEFPLSPLELIAINDLFNCTFQGAVRRNYMNAKAVELFALAMHHLSDSEAGEREVTLSRQDRQRITNAHAILIHEMSEQLTLDQLARRVGVNRSKLAKGFKSIYGASVQAYWRNLRLCRARELLTIERMSVTDVATAVGYADISCLTRAFERRFGILPKDCRSSLFNKRCVDN